MAPSGDTIPPAAPIRVILNGTVWRRPDSPKCENFTWTLGKLEAKPFIGVVSTNSRVILSAPKGRLTPAPSSPDLIKRQNR